MLPRVEYVYDIKEKRKWFNLSTCLNRIENRKYDPGNSLAVQWLRLCAFIAKDTSSTPGWGTKIPYV